MTPPSPAVLGLLRGALAPPLPAPALLIRCQGRAGPAPGREAPPTLVVTFADESGAAAVAHHYSAGASRAVPVQALASEVVRVDLTGVLPGLAADLLATCCAWDTPAALPELIAQATARRPGRRILVAAVLGELGGTWRDGALGHALPAGSWASYLPSGGAGALAVPVVTASGLTGAPLAAAAGLEGKDEARAHRCLAGRIAAHLAGAGGPGGAIALADFSLRSALALVLIRQARGPAPLRLVVPVSRQAVPPPWRRLCQNLGAELVSAAEAGEAGALAGGPHDALALAAMAELIPTPWAAALLRSVNSGSAVVPPSLAGGG